jgi:molybdenum cofactor cytidylyltransferase
MDEAVDCVMLAAGESRRMGEWKLMLPLAGSTVLGCSIENALTVCSRVILVTGHRAGELEELFGRRDEITTVYNPGYRKPMFSSIKLGVASVNTERFFIALGDMPLVDRSVYETLLRFRQAPVVIPKYKGKKGHPLLLSGELVKAIVECDEKSTLRDVCATYPTLAVPVGNPNILADIDSTQDYKNIMDGRSHRW